MKSVKKLIFVLIMALLVVSPLVNVDAKSSKTSTTTTTTATTTKKSKKSSSSDEQGTKVKFYIFYGDGCPHCQELHEYVEELEADKTINYMFERVDYEVWNNSTNYDLMTKVAEKFDFDVQGVPFYVIGDKYYSGFGDTSKDEIVEAIKAYYSGEEKYTDVVATVGTGESDGSDATEEEDTTDSNLVGMIILGVVVVIIIILIIVSSKSKEETEEAIESAEEVEEIKVEKPVAVEKKETAEKKSAAKATKTTAKATTKSASKSNTAKKTTAKKTTSKTVAKKSSTKKN